MRHTAKAWAGRNTLGLTVKACGDLRFLTRGNLSFRELTFEAVSLCFGQQPISKALQGWVGCARCG